MHTPDHTRPTYVATLSLPAEERWTLHHVLLDRIEHERTAEEPTQIEPPSVEVFRAFETLDAGDTSFTVGQLEEIRAVLATYQRSTDWVGERARIEQLLSRVTELIEPDRAPGPDD